MNVPLFGVDPLGPPVLALQEWPAQKAWSYSAVSSHSRCPLSVRFRKIDRYTEPKSEAMERGSRIHADLAHYIGSGDFPEDSMADAYAAWIPTLDALRAQGATPEHQLAFTKEWAMTEWFGSGAWLRVIFDAIAFDPVTQRVTVYEHKTGKSYPEHAQQMRLYCLAALRMFPQAHDARCVIHYIDKGPDRCPELVLQRSVLDDLTKEFLDFSQELLNDTIYPARPGPYCNWCAFKKSAGGPCAYG